MIAPDYIERSHRKTLSLVIMKDGNVVVKAPLKMADSVINHFVEEKQKWLKEKLDQINANRSRFKNVINYKEFLLYGNSYNILFGTEKTIMVSDNFQIVLPERYRQEPLKPLKSWFKAISREIFVDRIKHFEEKMQVKSSQLKIGDSVSNWGYCNSRGMIMLNFRVIMLPPKLIDYVVVHELCHLKEMNHSRKFWNLVSTFLPNYISLKQQMKEYKFLLNLYKK